MTRYEGRPKRGDLVEVDITSLAANAYGSGRLASETGKTYSLEVRNALPGERVEARIERVKGGRLSAGLVSLITPSPQRLEPRCPHFGRREEQGRGCGGCTLQSLDYATQLELKRGHITEALAEAGVSIEVPEVIGQDEPWYYRNKMEFSFGDTPERAFSLGLHPTGYKHDVLPLEECYLESSFASELVPYMRAWAQEVGLQPLLFKKRTGFLRTLTVREGKRTNERMIMLTTTGDARPETHRGPEPAEAVAAQFEAAVRRFSEQRGEPVTSVIWTQHDAQRGRPTQLRVHTLSGAPVLREELRIPGVPEPLRFEIHPHAFFQPNTLQAEQLYAVVARLAELGSSQPHLLDLYCGTGTIGLSLASGAKDVLGIELREEAVVDARRNAARNGIENVTFVAGDVTAILSSREVQPDLVIVDPPRSGLGRRSVAQLVGTGAPRIVYVSCNPTALATDLQQLRSDGYEVVAIQPVDMFPQTFHVETVVRLERVTAG